MPRAVLLLHTLPSGESHFDWLTASTGDADAALVAFRVGVRIDDAGVRAFDAEPLPDHRTIYLDFEGPLEPKEGRVRGDVVRLARAEAQVRTRDDRLVIIDADWFGSAAGPRRYEGRPRAGGLYRFIVTDRGASGR